MFIRFFGFWFIVLSAVTLFSPLNEGIQYFCDGIRPCDPDGIMSDREVIERAIIVVSVLVLGSAAIAKIMVNARKTKGDQNSDE